MTTYRCQSCGVAGTDESIGRLTSRQNPTAWQFILFDYNRRPTIICSNCFAGYDFVYFSDKVKRVPEHKVNVLMSEAITLVRLAEARYAQPDAQLIRTLISWAE